MNTQKGCYSLQHQLMSKGKRGRKSPNEKRKSSQKCEALRVVYISTPMKVTTSASKFREIVQGLTGRESDVVRIMESCGGNDTWTVDDHHHNHNHNHNDGVISSSPATTTSPSSSSEELVGVPFDEDNRGVFERGQDSNFGIFDHSSLFCDQFFQQLDVLGSW